jgi:hypothetical protein
MIIGIKRHSGIMLIITGWIHTLIGVAIFSDPLIDMLQAGILNSIDMQYERSTVFWFIFAGLMIILLGHLMDWIIKKKNMILPSSLGWYLLALCTIGIIIMPLSGFWIVLPQALIIISGGRDNKVHS